jgi:hypothetical protein
MTTSQIAAAFVVPSTDLILLTDENWSAGIFTTPEYQWGLMLSRGAIRFLYHSWFSDQAMAVDRIVTELHLGSDIAPRFNTDVMPWLAKHPGLIISNTPPSFTPVRQEEVTASTQRSLSTTGLKSVTVTPGRVLTRHIAGFLVQYHSRAEPLPDGTVPIIDTPQTVGLSQEPDAFLLFMPRPTSGSVAASCGVCGACATCAGCALCGNVNFSVAATHATALGAIVNLAAAIQP